jgi:DNA transposition AAA+ family ATPase
LFDFINGFEEGLFDELDRLKLIKSFIWDVSLEGADDSEIRKFLSENKTPKPGSIRAHNERVKWEAVAPDLKMSDNKAFFDLMKTYLSACMNRPDSWLGSGGKAYQSEADLMGEPTFKDLGCRQRHVKYMLEFVLCFVLDQAVLHKRISPPGDRYSRFRVRVNMPKMTTRDLKKTVESINTLTDALDRARERGWVDDKTAAGLFESAIRRLGEDIQTPETEKRENQK